MHLTKSKKAAAGTLLLASTGLLGLVGTNADAAGTAAGPTQTQTHATLHALNNAAAHGTATVTIDGRKLDVSIDAARLLKAAPHAEHIHFGRQARQECPTVRDDSNADHRLNTAEGIPAYGPVRVSLTTRGDTSPDSTLAVDRYPTAPKGSIHYDREIKVGSRLARAISRGHAVVVIHGIDYNHNGTYDFDGAGASELDPNLPAEATDPVLCGRLKVQKGVLTVQ